MTDEEHQQQIEERRRKEEERVWNRVQKGAGCWLWTGPLHRQGYGRLGFRGNRSFYAHRATWILSKGAIPEGMEVCHSCDNPQCVRPSHLFLGSHGENMRDAMRKGRLTASRPRGEANNKSVLTEDQAKRIKYGHEPLQALSNELGITYQSAWYIRKNQTWRHI